MSGLLCLAQAGEVRSLRSFFLPSARVSVLAAAALPFPLYLPLDLSPFSHSVLSSVSDLERAKQKQSKRY